MKAILTTIGFSLLLLITGLFAQTTRAAVPSRAQVDIFDSETFLTEASFSPFGDTKESYSLTTGDVNGDEVDEVIVGSANGHPPRVRVYTGDGTLLTEFLAYGESFTGGVHLTTCDLDANGKDEIITGAGFGGGPHVMVYDYLGIPFLSDGFFAYDEAYHGGVKVACGDVDGNKLNEIITITDLRTQPHIKIFTRSGSFTGKEFFVTGYDNYTGVNLEVIRFHETDPAHIIVAGAYNTSPLIRIFQDQGTEVKSFYSYAETFRGGVNLSKHTSNDGAQYILTGAGMTGGPHVRVFDFNGAVQKEFFPYDRESRGGVSVASGDFDVDGVEEFVVKIHAFQKRENIVGKSIEVDISEQTLYAYDAGYLVGEFLISSGVRGFDTPQGEFNVWRKRSLVDMSWYYGSNSPYNYRLPNVPWVLSFLGPYTIHGTYWHSNFGNPMSHGCVNMYTPDVEWLFAWTPMNTPVNVHE